MSDPIYIPMAGISLGNSVVTGPGSQLGIDDEMPILDLPTGGMNTFQAPILPEPEEIEDLVDGMALLEKILAALRSFTIDGPNVSIPLSGLDTANMNLVNQALGEGEVAVRFDGPAPILAQESVLAGLWRVQHLDTHGQVIMDCLEVGAIPVFACPPEADPEQQVKLDEIPDFAQNAPALLVEINDQIRHRQPGDAQHVINLTLLPITEQELLLLGERLGVGPVTILSRGYGNCRIGATAFPNVWWIKYFNSEDRLILNTIEISEMPEVALAAPEDIADSAERLDEILAIYR